RREVARAITPAMRSLTIVGSPINTLLKGNKLLQQALRPGAFTEMSKLADAVAQGGGRFQMDPFYKNEAIDSFWRAWKMGEYGKAGLRAFPATLELLAKPVMEYAVPRMKLGAMANLLEDAIARAEQEEWSPERRRNEFGKIV